MQHQDDLLQFMNEVRRHLFCLMQRMYHLIWTSYLTLFYYKKDQKFNSNYLIILFGFEKEIMAKVYQKNASGKAPNVLPGDVIKLCLKFRPPTLAIIY